MRNLILNPRPLYCALLLFIAAGGCKKVEPAANGNGEMRMIQSPGTYDLPGSPLTLTVWIDSAKTVQYLAKDTAGVRRIESEQRPSNHQNWCLYWDARGWLWAHSSDIGESVWRPDASGSYSQTVVAGQPDLIEKMPAEVFAALPSSLQALWGAQRKPPDN